MAAVGHHNVTQCKHIESLMQGFGDESIPEIRKKFAADIHAVPYGPIRARLALGIFLDAFLDAFVPCLVPKKASVFVGV